MIGLYILITTQLAKDSTIKFGMSMRIECRWIDYQIIFNDSKYIYYYEFLDDLTREQIFNIEYEIIQLHLKERNYNYQTEYFYCNDYEKFHESIIKVLNEKKINYKIHDKHDFDKKDYDRKPEIFIPIFPTKNNLFTPYDYQQDILDKIENFYCNNNIGKLIWCCGLGKALMSILIIQKLNYKSVVIGVPSINLQQQIKNEILKIFNNPENILYIGGQTETNENYTIHSTTNNNIINKFINKKSNECKFFITTYSSCFLLSNNYSFDFKIGDEAHHLVGTENENTKDSFHKIKSNKTLFMTATEKVIENRTNKIIYSMEDENIFGKLLDCKSICWAIENKKITDYNILILKNTNDEINDIITNLTSLNTDNEDINIINSITENKELFLSAYMTLKSIEKYEDLIHVLIYTNSTASAELVKVYINLILKLNILTINKDNYYNKALHSGNVFNIDNEINEFKKAKWGIISSVYIFGEGFDCPILYGVVFAENMESEIRIVQGSLRANRLDKNNPNKKSYIIIPYIDTNDFTVDNNSYDKCRKIISKIRNVDENIQYKITVQTLEKKKYNTNNTENITSTNNIRFVDYINNSNELTKIILRLRHSKALYSKCSEEQDEFNYVRELNKELNIQSKEEYVKHKHYIQNPEEYFRLKGVWSSWYDFLGVDTLKFIQDKNNWINFCKKNNVKSLEDYNELCKLYQELPINPADFYKEFSNIIYELQLNKSRR